MDRKKAGRSPSYSSARRPNIGELMSDFGSWFNLNLKVGLRFMEGLRSVHGWDYGCLNLVPRAFSFSNMGTRLDKFSLPVDALWGSFE